MKVLLLLLLLGVALRSGAQPLPPVVLIAKLDGYTQVSAAELRPDGATFRVQVGGNVVPFASTLVQVRAPSGSVTPLQRLPDGSHFLERTFASRAALEATFPDGDYTIVFSDPSIVATVVSVPAIDPVAFSNFAAWQVSPVDDPVVRWAPIPGIKSVDLLGDLLSITVKPPDGEVLFRTEGELSLSATSFGLPHLPTDVPLTVELAYVSVARVPNTNRTPVFVGRGFSVKAPFRVGLASPTIETPPSGVVTEVGGSAYFEVIASGQQLSYQWLRNGEPITGATAQQLALSEVRAGDAGRYAVKVSNTSGAVTSVIAGLAVSPVLRTTTWAGSPRLAGNADGVGARAGFFEPSGVALDAAGSLWVADAGNSTVRRVAPDGTVMTVAGVAGQSGWADGTGAAARFRRPGGLTIDRNGTVFVSDRSDHVIRKITAGGVATTLAGTAGLAGYVDAAGSAARFREPDGLAVDAAGNLYVSDSGNHVIRKISSAGVVTTWAGKGGSAAYADGLGEVARFQSPAGLALDAGENVVVADSGNRAVRRISPSGRVTTLAMGEGLGSPLAVAVDRSSHVFMSNLNRIYRITPDGWVVRVAGNPQFVGHRDGQGAEAAFYAPAGLVFDRTGVLFMSDTNSHVLRRAEWVPGSDDPLVTVDTPPRSAVIERGGAVAFNALANGPGVTYQWFRNSAPLSGATRDTLVLRRTSEADLAEYTLLVGNAAGFLKSAPVAVSFAPTTNAARIVNLAIRSIAGQGAQSLLVGFAVRANGTAPGAALPVLSRAVGPGLAAFGVANALAAPQLSLFRAAERIGFNDNWVTGDARLGEYSSAVGAFALARDSRDAALYQSLSPGPYSAQVTSATAAGGLALAEVYDATPAGGTAVARLVNVSARSQVGTGTDVLIAGLVIAGTASQTVLIRAVGSELRSFGLTGVLLDPKLEIYAGASLLAANDNWASDIATAAVFQSVGAFQLSPQSRDAATILTLPPGAYSVKVSGVGTSTGLALVEIYEVPN